MHVQNVFYLTKCLIVTKWAYAIQYKSNYKLWLIKLLEDQLINLTCT